MRLDDLPEDLRRIAEEAIRDHEHRVRMARLDELRAEMEALLTSWRVEEAEHVERERRARVPVAWPAQPSRRRDQPPIARIAWTASLRAFA